jgi:anti-sigma regulatory factor (Ser/Thr protein kinase)
MAMTAGRARLLTNAALGAGLWTVFGILWATPSMLGVDPGEEGRSLWEAADHVIVFYWAWAVITPLVLLVARRAARLHHSRIRMVALVVLAGPAVILVQALVYYGLIALLGIDPPAQLSGLLPHLKRHAGGDVATYLTLIGGYLLLDTDRRARRNELAAAELLRWQLQPHFLFNALNTVSTLVLKQEVEPAQRAIELIARYLRDALAQTADTMITLDQELIAVRDYVEIERLRFGDALTLAIDASDEALQARLPNSLLQPLVENAIRHGLVPAQGGRVTISAQVSGRRLRVTVTDPGSASAEAGRGDDGFGLRYVKERMRQRYGPKASLALSITPQGSVAALDVPLERA